MATILVSDIQSILTTEERLELWRLSNKLRAAQGQSELLFADYRAFLVEFEEFVGVFNAVVADAVALQQAVEEERAR